MTTHGCLGCLYIETSQVTLRDGRIVCSSCDDWRLECEARHVIAMPTLKARRQYLIKILENRGEKETQRLENEIRQQWEKQGVRPSPIHAPTKKRGPKPPKPPASSLFSE